MGTRSASDIDIILALLEDFLVSLQVWDNWLEPGKMNSYRTCHCLKVFFGIFGGS